MQHILWIAAAVAGLLILALCCATAFAVLRRAARRRIARWPAVRIIVVLVGAAVPWLIVWLAPIKIEVAIGSAGQLVAWLVLALFAFALLVLVPLAAVLSGLAWWIGRRGQDSVSPVPNPGDTMP